MAESNRPPSKQRRRRDPARLPFLWAMKSATREGEMYRRVARDLRAQIGGNPTAAQELLIGRIAWLQVHLAKIDERALQTGELSDHASRQYLAWANALSRMLQALGLEGAPAPQPSVQDRLAEIHARAAGRTAGDE